MWGKGEKPKNFLPELSPATTALITETTDILQSAMVMAGINTPILERVNSSQDKEHIEEVYISDEETSDLEVQRIFEKVKNYYHRVFIKMQVKGCVQVRSLTIFLHKIS
jgi:hypothetical protein